MNIRRATLADAKRLAELNRDVQQLHVDMLPSFFKQPIDLSPIVSDFLQRILTNPNGCVWIAEHNGEAIGYICAEQRQRPETAYTYEQDTVYIDQIGVKPAYQNKGSGRALIQAVFDWARAAGIERVLLDTYAFNISAQGFFREMGFETLRIHMVAHMPSEDGQ